MKKIKCTHFILSLNYDEVAKQRPWLQLDETPGCIFSIQLCGINLRLQRISTLKYICVNCRRRRRRQGLRAQA